LFLLYTTLRFIAWGADERFSICSTFKLLLVAAILHVAEAGRVSLATVLHYTQADMAPHAAPRRRPHEYRRTCRSRADDRRQRRRQPADPPPRRAGEGHRLDSRNGDKTPRVDRYETVLNVVSAGEPRDSTTPRATASTAAHVMSGKYLSSDDRARLRAWMIATEIGKFRLRAGLPEGLIAGTIPALLRQQICRTTTTTLP